MKITANLSIVIASIAVITGVLFIPNSEYRWIGHSIIGLATFSFVVATTIYGATLAGRIRRPPNRARFRLHRKLGIIMGFLIIAAFSYGLGMAISQRVILLNSIHGMSGLLIVTLSVVQIIAGLSLRRSLMKSVHHWNGYILAGLIVFQVAFGVLSSPLFTSSGEYPRYTVRWLTLLDETWRPDGTIGPREYFITRVLDEGNYEMSYRTDGEYIYVGLKVKTTGWVGVGISAGDGMRDADFVFAYVTDDGRVIVEDHFSISRTQHLPDTELGGTNDIVEHGGREEEGFTIIEFKRPMVTDDKFDISLAEGVQTVIWAYGTGDSSEMHIAQGYIEIVLGLR